MFSSRAYSPVEQIDDDDSASEKLLAQWLDPKRHLGLSRYRKFWRQYWAYFTHGVLLFLSLLFFALWIRARYQHQVESVYCKPFITSQWGFFQTRGVAPANEAIEYNRELTMFNGTFNFPSEFRGPPTPEIDAAWMGISQGGELHDTCKRNISTRYSLLMALVKPTRLTLEQVLKIGKFDTPSKVKFREEDGGGYMASMEVTHQLHCLVRRVLA